MRIYERILEYNSWKLEESVQAAKDYLIKRYALSKKIKASEIPDDIKNEIVRDPKFEEIKELMTSKGFPNYTQLFTQFAFDQNAPSDALVEIVGLLKQYKGNLSIDLSMPVLDFGKIIPTKEDNFRKGYEVLWDELRAIPKKIKLRKLYKVIKDVPQLKKEFEKASDEEISKLEDISFALDNLPDKSEYSQELGKEIVVNAWRNFVSKIYMYRDTVNFPQYADSKLAFEDMIKHAQARIDSWNESIDEIIKKIANLKKQAKILYSKGGVYVISARTPEAVLDIAGDANWCIRTAGQFWNYAENRGDENRVQLIILDKNKSSIDPLSTIGVTINNKNLRIVAAHDKNDTNIMRLGSDLPKFLSALDFSKDLIDTTVEKVDVEFTIKGILERIFRKIDTEYNKKSKAEKIEFIISTLLNSSKSFRSGTMEKSEFDEIVTAIVEIMESDQSISMNDFKKFYTTSGIVSLEQLLIFEMVFLRHFTKSEIGEVEKSSLASFEDLEYLYSGKISGLGPDQLKKIGDILKNKEEVLQTVSKL